MSQIAIIVIDMILGFVTGDLKTAGTARIVNAGSIGVCCILERTISASCKEFHMNKPSQRRSRSLSEGSRINAD